MTAFVKDIIRLEDFSLQIADNQLLGKTDIAFGKGALISLIGRNGTGKSTLLRAIARLNRFYGGRVFINGKLFESLNTEEFAKQLSFVTTERIRITNLSCFEVVALGRAPYTNWIGRLSGEDKAIIEEALRLVGMENYAGRTMDKMSDGECQRIMIARALAQQTPIILLDEPTSFLDFPARYELIALLRGLAHEKGKCILFSTHELDIALKMSDFVALLNNKTLTLFHTALEAPEASLKAALEDVFNIQNLDIHNF